MTARKIGRYTLTRECGRGGMGAVYQALSPEGETVAVKTVLLPEGVDPRDRWEAIERFQREARAARSLSHPNICQVLDFGADEDTLYIVMEFLDGETVSDLIALAGGIRAARAVEIVRDVGEGLGHAHEQGIIHRDVKPRNIMVLRAGQVKLADFGVASIVQETTLTQTGATLGTVYYMSPEQVRGEKVDARSDIFSLGSTFYEMLAGTRPFEGEDRIAVMNQVLTKDPAPIPGLPSELSEVLQRCLRKDPQERFQSTRDLIASLSAIEPETVTGSTALLSPAEQTPAAARPSRRPWLPRMLRRWPVVTLAIAAVVVLGALATLSLREGSPTGRADGEATELSLDPPPRLETAEEREADVRNRANFTAQVDFRENPGAFDLGSGPDGEVTVDGDSLVVDSKGLLGSAFRGGALFTEFVIEARMTKLEGPEDPDPSEAYLYGLIFGSWPTETYTFSLHTHGEVSIYRHDNAQFQDQEGEAAHGRTGDVKDPLNNVMKVVRCGDCLDVWVDGRHIRTLEDFTLGPGRLGVYAVRGLRVGFSEVSVAGIDARQLEQDVLDHRRKLEQREAIKLLRYLHRFKCGNRRKAVQEARASPDWRETVLVITSSDPAAVVRTQEAATRLREAINARGKGRDWRFAKTLTDTIDRYHQKAPLITTAVGQPWEKANQNIYGFTESLPSDPASTKDVRISQDIDRGGRRVGIWGSSKENVEKAVDLFISRGLLDAYLEMIWEET